MPEYTQTDRNQQSGPSYNVSYTLCYVYRVLNQDRDYQLKLKYEISSDSDNTKKQAKDKNAKYPATITRYLCQISDSSDTDFYISLNGYFLLWLTTRHVF